MAKYKTKRVAFGLKSCVIARCGHMGGNGAKMRNDPGKLFGESVKKNGQSSGADSVKLSNQIVQIGRFRKGFDGRCEVKRARQVSVIVLLMKEIYDTE